MALGVGTLRLGVGTLKAWMGLEDVFPFGKAIFSGAFAVGFRVLLGYDKSDVKNI